MEIISGQKCPKEASTLTTHPVFSGIDLTCHEVHTSACALEKPKLDHVFEISHCLEGRMECEADHHLFYLSQGDLSISRRDQGCYSCHFPLGYYRGITVGIDIFRAPDCLSCFLDDVNVKPAALLQKYCGTDPYFLSRSRPCLDHIFSELYTVPAGIQKGYFKVKILELFLFLGGVGLEADCQNQISCSCSQANLARDVCWYLTGHMDRRITLDQLSRRFHVSGTLIKSSFRDVYGVSVHSYIRTQKIQAAARMLLRTDCTVLEVAGRFGYDNGSKFAGSFREIMGMPPNEYRKTMANK